MEQFLPQKKNENFIGLLDLNEFFCSRQCAEWAS